MKKLICRRANRREASQTAPTRRAVGLLAILLFMAAIAADGGLRAETKTSLLLQNTAKSSRRIHELTSAPALPSASTHLEAVYSQLPLRFEPNQGQTNAKAKFIARTPGYVIFLTENSAVLAFGAKSKKTSAGARRWVRMQWLGSEPAPLAAGRVKLASESNYFLGNNPGRWRTRIPNYAQAVFHNVYPGVDLDYHGNPRQLEYDFRVAPGKDASHLAFSLTGSSGPLPLRLDARGDLLAEIPGVRLRFSRPSAYQDVSQRGKRVRRPVTSRYDLKSPGRARIVLGAYDRSRPLVIDPVLLYSTYLGGAGADAAEAVAVDGSGDAFVTGGETSVNFPTANPLRKSNAGSSDVFVAELNPAGTSLIYSTYLGGSAFDKGTAIAIDSSGSAYVTGYTSSPDFPTTSKSFQTTYLGNSQSEAFVVKLSAGGSALAYSTYLGGTGGDFGQGIAADSTGDAYVTGSTQSSDFPVANPLQATLGGGSDAFVTELNPAGASLVYSTFLGGAGSDSGQAIAVDSAGEAFVTGFTFSTNFPTQNPFQSVNGGSTNAFVSKLSAGGSALLYSTYLGGSGDDRAFGVALDSAGDAYVTGAAQSANFPTTTGAYQTALGGGTNAFISKLSPSGAQLSYSTFVGGSAADQGNGIAVDAAGDAFIVGSTSSSNFPTLNPTQSALAEGSCSSPCSNAFVSELKTQGNALVYSTYLGGSGPDYGQGIAVDSSGNAYVAGATASSNFPIIAGAVQGVYGGTGTSGNGFVVKIGPNSAPGVSLNPQTLDFGNQGEDVTSAAQTVILTDAGSAPLTISSITTTGQFAQTNTCGSGLQAGGSQCTISVTFTPTAISAETGSVMIADDAAGSPHQVSLSGTGVTPVATASFSPTSLTFPTQLAGTSSPAQTVTLTNTGGSTLSVTQLAASSPFTETNNCPGTVFPSGSCVISIVYSPTSGTTGTTDSGSLTITDGLTGTQPSVTLTGTEEADFALAVSGSVGTPLIGTNSVVMTLSATNLLSSSATGALSLGCSGGGVTCTFNPTQISPGQSTAATIDGLSTAAASSNPLTITFSGSNSAATQTASATQSISFQDYAVSASPSLDSIAAGQAATYAVTLTPISGFNQAVTFSCPSGLPGGAQCAFSPSSAASTGGSPVNTTLTITTTAHTTSSGRAAPAASRKTPPAGGGMAACIILLLMVLGLGTAVRFRPSAKICFLAGVLALIALLFAGCQNYYGFLGSNPAPTGSPSGVYTVTISGTFTPSTGAISRTTTVNLAIQ